VTGRARFGDFLWAAHRRLDPPSGIQERGSSRGDLEEVIRSLLRALTIMGRFVRDVTPALDEVPRQAMPAMEPWGWARLQAGEALTNSADVLLLPASARRQRELSQSADPLARRLDDATALLVTGRDLLQTHYGPAFSRARHHSEWGPVITSPLVTRALLTELSSFARCIAQQGAERAMAPSLGTREAEDPQRRLLAACQWLWVLDSSVRVARQREPVPQHDLDLLRAIPVNTLPSRQLPSPAASVGALCEGVIASAERVRHLAWVSAEQACWSPNMTVTSLRRVAGANTVTSHNCALVLQSLAARIEHSGSAEISARLFAAADNAGRARDHWLHVARAIGQVTTDTRRHVSQAASEASDLALWTGRLAYADPEWTPARGPAHEARPPVSLAPTPAEVPPVVAAVHHALETVTQVSSAEWEHVASAAGAGRILVPTRSLLDADIPRPYARAPQERVDLLLSQYRNAGQVSRQATGAVGDIATAIRAPSRILNTAQAAVQTSPPGRSDSSPIADVTPGTRRDHIAIGGVGEKQREGPGEVESTLLSLGIAHPELLHRGANIDTALQHLNNDVAAELQLQRREADTAAPAQATAATFTKHASRPVDPSATTQERRQARADREPEPEA
jgi:hypothetical protein